MASRRLILGTAGHIDHGKTALVRALTGIDTDRLPQEKARGITIDLGFAHLDLDDRRVGIVDVPGHERFIRNMLAGASGIDLALLVVAADDSVMPQTREHLAILELLGVRHGLIALTKCDLGEPGWLDAVEEEVRELVRGTFLANAPIVRTSATTGDGLDPLRATLAGVCEQVDDVTDDLPFRLAVDRSFVQQGVGTVVTGTVYSGTLTVGAPVEWQPKGQPVRVRGIQSHGAEVEQVGRGERAAINLMGVHHTEIHRGDELATPGFLRPSRLLTVRLHVLEHSPWPVRRGAWMRLHLGTQEVMARVNLIGTSKVEPGSWTYARLATAKPTLAIGGQAFVLRTESPLVTIGGGRVLQPIAHRLGRRDAAADERLDDLHAGDDATRADATLRLYGTKEWTPLDLTRDAALSVDRVAAVLETLAKNGTIVELPSSSGRQVRLHREVLETLETRVLQRLETLHAQAPLESAVPRARLMQRLEKMGDEALLAALLGRLIETGRATGDERAVALARFQPRLSGEEAALRERVVGLFHEAAFAPPDMATLARETGAADGTLRPILDLCVHDGVLVHLGAGMYLHRDTETELRRRLTEELADPEGLTMSRIRDVLGTTRKYALPMCEYLDRAGVTRRVGDRRVLAGR